MLPFGSILLISPTSRNRKLYRRTEGKYRKNPNIVQNNSKKKNTAKLTIRIN